MVKLIINKIMKNTWYLGLIKHFLTVVIGIYIAEGMDLFSLDLTMAKKLIGAGFAACLPVILNLLNPQYKGYGVSKEPLKPIKKK